MYWMSDTPSKIFLLVSLSCPTSLISTLVTFINRPSPSFYICVSGSLKQILILIIINFTFRLHSAKVPSHKESVSQPLTLSISKHHLQLPGSLHCKPACLGFLRPGFPFLRFRFLVPIELASHPWSMPVAIRIAMMLAHMFSASYWRLCKMYALATLMLRVAPAWVFIHLRDSCAHVSLSFPAYAFAY